MGAVCFSAWPARQHWSFSVKTKTDSLKEPGCARGLVPILGVLMLARLLTLGIAPLYDPTEGRYATIAKHMLVSGDWVTPRLDYVTPFWGKPPLHFWMTAVCLKLFGMNAFAA